MKIERINKVIAHFEARDFYNVNEMNNAVKGFRFDEVHVPVNMVDGFLDSPLGVAIRGSLFTGMLLTAKIVGY